MTGIVSGCLASVASVFACCKLLGLSPVIYYSLIPKSITSSIAVSVSEEIGGISALTVALVVLTGLLGAAIASGMVKLLHLKNKVAIGLAIGHMFPRHRHQPRYADGRGGRRHEQPGYCGGWRGDGVPRPGCGHAAVGKPESFLPFFHTSKAYTPCGEVCAFSFYIA